MDVIKDLKQDMKLKDDELFPIFDTVKEKLCFYFGKFSGHKFYVCFVDKTEETGTKFSYEVLWKIMTGWYIPVNSFHLFMGRKRTNYYEFMVNQYVVEHHIEFGKEFTVEAPSYHIADNVSIPLDVKTEICVIYRNCKLYRNGEEDMEFLFKHLLEI